MKLWKILKLWLHSNEKLDCQHQHNKEIVRMNMQDIKDQATSGIDAAFNLGVLSVGTTPTFTQADVDAAVSASKAALIASFQSLVDAEDTDLKAKIAAL